MRKGIKALALAAIVMFAAACGAKTLITSEQILAATGSQFVATGATFNTMCQLDANPKMDAKTCQEWKEFAPEFKFAFAQAEGIWNEIAACEIAEAEVPTGRECGDTKEAVDTILRVKNVLLQFIFKLAAKGGV